MSKEFDDFMKSVEYQGDDLCISCDEHKTTHNICMDCIGKMIKNDVVAFAKWVSGSYSFGNVIGKWFSHENTSKEYTEEELYKLFKSDNNEKRNIT